MSGNVRTFGILTSGGDAPGLNAAIRGVCRSAIKDYGMKVIGIRNGFKGLVYNDCFEMSSDDFSGILTRGGTILGTSRYKPFKDPEPDPNTKLLPLESIIKTYEKWKMDALVCLGGNGTNTTANKLAEQGLNVIGLPKTIDNDIIGTDITFGFHTALNVATDAIDRIHTTANSHNRVMVVEVMGHKAGWLGLYSGVASGSEVILLPEIPYDIKKVADYLTERKNSGGNFAIVVVAEGAISKEEANLSKKEFKKARLKMPGSIGYRVAKELEEETGLEARVSVLGYLQRGGTPTAYDRILATQFGTSAAKFLAEGNFGNLVAMRNNEITGFPLSGLAGKVKNIPLDHPMIETARSLGICFGD